MANGSYVRIITVLVTVAMSAAITTAATVVRASSGFAIFRDCELLLK